MILRSASCWFRRWYILRHLAFLFVNYLLDDDVQSARRIDVRGSRRMQAGKHATRGSSGTAEARRGPRGTLSCCRPPG